MNHIQLESNHKPLVPLLEIRLFTSSSALLQDSPDEIPLNYSKTSE